MSAREIVWPALLNFWRETEGQDMVEYSLLLGFIALTIVSVLDTAKNSITSIWTRASTLLSTGAAAS